MKIFAKFLLLVAVITSATATQGQERATAVQDQPIAEEVRPLSRDRADEIIAEQAEAKQQREIETVKAREQAEILRVQAEERLRAETARIKTDEELAVSDQNRQREVQVAEKNRERVVLVETERVEKDRALEAVSRERETELARIAKEKELEVEKKNIADVVRSRIAVEKTVAEGAAAATGSRGDRTSDERPAEVLLRRLLPPERCLFWPADRF